MTVKTSRRCVWVFLLVFLVACDKQTVILPTETSVPTVVPSTPFPISTLMPFIVTPSPLPPEPTIVVFTPEQEVLKSVIQSYFDARYLAFNTFQLEGFDNLVSDQPDGKAFLHAELAKLAVDIKFTRLNNSRYMSYKYFLDFRNIVVDPITQMVTITVIEDNEVTSENSARGNPENPLVSRMSGLEHTIVLREENGQWKIVSDTYYDFLWRTVRKSEKSMDERLKIIKGAPLPVASRIFALTLEPAQLEKWKEYEGALAEKLMPLSRPKEVLCEWEILGRADQEMYVWAVCTETKPDIEISPFFFRAASVPAVLHLETDGTIQSVEIPEYGSGYLSDVRRIFPPEIQKKHADIGRMEKNLDLRREHPENPPLIILSPLLPQPANPMIMPDPVQVERWKEYQTALAKNVLSYLPSEDVICEWEVLGRSDQDVPKIYVWAACLDTFSVGLDGLPYRSAMPIVIYLNIDGSILSVETPSGEPPDYSYGVRRMFPTDMQEKYFNGQVHFQDLLDHLQWRLEHQEEPPLIVINATPSP